MQESSSQYPIYKVLSKFANVHIFFQKIMAEQSPIDLDVDVKHEITACAEKEQSEADPGD